MTKYLDSGPMFFSNVRGETAKRDPEKCGHERKVLKGSAWWCVDCDTKVEANR